jgi:hypothetical protein
MSRKIIIDGKVTTNPQIILQFGMMKKKVVATKAPIVKKI